MARVEVSRIGGGGYIKTIVMLDKIVEILVFLLVSVAFRIPLRQEEARISVVFFHL